ncbi:MAG: metal-dependent hydrolase [Candidatus Thermoplasmatota archaeon]|nr:metal-dependent hydrolase [Candidatus Thermoplasmatota archaeon]
MIAEDILPLTEMDPFMHLLLPLLFLLAVRVDAKKAILFAPLAILPDFDALFGLHRALFHSFIPILVIPLAFVVYSKLRRPEWMFGSVIALFYLSSHVVLDLGGVAFFWPFVQEQFYFVPEVQFNLQGGVNFNISIDYGMKELEEMGTASFLSQEGAALLLLGVLVLAVFHKEALQGLRTSWAVFRDFLAGVFRRWPFK